MSRDRSIPWLVLRAQSGDRAALEELLLLTHATLRPYVSAMTADPDLAADVLQEVLVTAYRKLDALRDPRAYLAWVRRIASRAATAAMRRARPTVPIDDVPLPDDGHDDADDPRAELGARLPELLRRVSPASREVLALHYGDELTIEQIAVVLDVPVGTVKSRLGYGLRQLRALVAATA